MSITEESTPAADDSVRPKPGYRRSVPVNAEVKEHCHIYLDEQIYPTALALLNDLVVTGAAHPVHRDRPTVVPDPHHIELACALLVHPRPTSQEAANLSLPSQSILFLRNVLINLGPRNANLSEAFSFSLTSTRKSRSSRIRYEDGSSCSDTEDKQEHVNGIIANNGRLRRCARDFWHVVGWAFNCSVRYPRRWTVWKVWLDYMLDVLEHDWTQREQEDLAEEDCWNLRRQSLIVKYLADAVDKSYAMKRIVRSAFADANAESLKDFPEIFPNETKKLSYGQKRKRDDPLGKMFGSYDDEDEAEFESDGSSQSSQDGDENEIMSGEDWLGDMDTMALRQRVIMLLSRVSAYLPECFADCGDVYDEIYQCAVRLPLPAFTQFMSTANSSQMPSFVFVTLAQLLLIRLLPLSAPRPQTIEDRNDDGVTQLMLERCFLPFASSNSTVADNARVSILAENFFRSLVRTGGCEYTLSLKAAVDKGILVRENKIKGDRRKKDSDARNKAEEGDMFTLKASGQRMRCLLAALRRCSSN
ncbi:hypothetical protein IFR04_014553 [Cadophora malorum]|uniref:Uncharacterized protein n=1 Tax=Cadophora malorum TaxID=108018 RepID=A0A8H7T343_9HELO|nr:hypothetical protein IFR04_014553 [Cadophora malorum]